MQTHLCMHTCTHIRTCTHMYAGMHVELCKCAYTWRCACDACSHTQTYAWMNMCTCTCKPASTSIHVFTCTYMLARTRAVTHACKRTHTCTWSSATVHKPPPLHVCTQTCTDVCINARANPPLHAHPCMHGRVRTRLHRRAASPRGREVTPRLGAGAWAAACPAFTSAQLSPPSL